jgi:membrane protein
VSVSDSILSVSKPLPCAKSRRGLLHRIFEGQIMLGKALRAIVNLFVKTFDTWGRHEPDLHATALAYTAIFSLAPLLLLVLIIAGQTFQSSVLSNTILTFIQSLAGQATGIFVRDLMVSLQTSQSTAAATWISFLFLLWGASGLVLRLRASLNTMWDLTPKPAPLRWNILSQIQQKVISGLVVILFGFLIWFGLIAGTLWSAFYGRLQQWLEYIGVALPVPNDWFIPLIYVLLFTAMFKTLPQAKIRWRDVLPGAMLTALLFSVGGFVINVYLSHFFLTSVYGAAGSTILFLLWIYYSAFIILFGAEFTFVYANQYGEAIAPNSDMMFKSSVSKEPAKQKAT